MSSPARPVSIRNRLARQDAPYGSQSGTPQVGTPALKALRAQYSGSGTPLPNIPPRAMEASPSKGFSPSTSPLPPRSIPLPSSESQVGGISASRTPGTPGSNSDVVPDLDDLPEEEKLRVLRRHLVSKDERMLSNVESPSSSNVDLSRTSSTREGTSQGEGQRPEEPFPVPFHAVGADVTHDIYKYHAKQQRQSARPRAQSYIAQPSGAGPAFEHIHEPGGFRRNYVLLRATQEGGEEPPPMLNNFIDFLFLYGHFAGEDLEEDEDEEDSTYEDGLLPGPSAAAVSAGLSDISEASPLLAQKVKSRVTRRSRSRRRASSMPPGGTASFTQAILMLVKAFIGTGVLFLGRAFFNGGILFSSLLFVFIAVVSLFSFLLLVETKFVVSGSFGDIGGSLYGPWMRNLILISIVISQLGFCAAYIIFVSENLQAFVLGISGCAKLIGVQYFIALQAILLLPMVLIRDLAKLSTAALVADFFILIGLVYIFGSEISLITQRGIADVKLFNPRDFPLFVGTAVFSFEGIGLVIPITDAMKEPEQFPLAITYVMTGLVVLFGGAGALAYMAFGSEVQAVVFVNLDTSKKMVQGVQLFYSVAIMLSVPLQLFPAVRIMENALFTKSGKGNIRVKWNKNLFRWCSVAFTALISWFGASDLDKFVAFVGCFACVPLCYVYPALLHLKACAHTRRQRINDYLMIGFGLLVAAYTSVQTINLMLAPKEGAPPPGRCDPPSN